MFRNIFPTTALFVLIVALFSGCGSINFNAKPYPIDPNIIPSIRGKNPITLINNQEDSNKFIIGNSVGKNFKGNLNQFTDVAIQTLQRELSNRGIIIESNAVKKISIAVRNVHFTIGLSSSCVSKIVIETEDGINTEYEGYDSHSWMVQPAINGSLNHAIVNMLNDPKFIKYIEN